MTGLRDRMASHAEKVRKHEEMEAALAGVFDQEAQAAREHFAALVNEVIKPAFNEFKLALREIGRDAVIVVSLAPQSQTQSIGLTLMDRYLKLGLGKTLNLVNPKEGVAKSPSAKFYEIFRADGAIFMRQRVSVEMGEITAQIGLNNVNPIFLENELAAFFERAYPAAL